MREIKFRGIHPGTGEIMDVCVIDWMHDEVYFEQGSDVAYPMDRCQLMQFTGLYDCNGVEIYEGDILTDGTENGCVLWFQGNCEFVLHHQDFIEEDDTDPGCDIDMSEGWVGMKIIGNIYQTPEMLK